MTEARAGTLSEAEIEAAREYWHSMAADDTEAVKIDRLCDQALAGAGMLEREGFYEKLWKDFVSLQRGDAQGICAKVEQYYRETALIPEVAGGAVQNAAPPIQPEREEAVAEKSEWDSVGAAPLDLLREAAAKLLEQFIEHDRAADDLNSGEVTIWRRKKSEYIASMQSWYDAYIAALSASGPERERGPERRKKQMGWPARSGIERREINRRQSVPRPERSLGHDEAQERISQCVREIEQLCDTFGYDPFEFLAPRSGTQLGEVVVPREPKPGLLCGSVAISTDPRYAGWVFVRHVDGINWTTGAKLSDETWAMLKAAPSGRAG